jgi:hypothetical protein
LGEQAGNVGGDHHALTRDAIGDDAADEQRRGHGRDPRRQDEADLRRGTAQLEHGERERDRQRPISEPGHRLRDERRSTSTGASVR